MELRGEAKKNLNNFWIFASDQALTGTLKELKDNESITKVHVTDTPTGASMWL